MSISTNQYDIAADEIIEYYSSLGYDLERVNIIDESNNLQPIFAPYIPVQTTPTIQDGGMWKRFMRMKKINKILNLGLDIKYPLSKGIASRYATINTNLPFLK